MIENEARYQAAIDRNIRNNRRIGNRARWEQESGVETVTRCMDFLGETGEFARIEAIDEEGYITSSKPHPLVKASYSPFYAQMGAAINEWGRLSPGQERAVLAMIDKAQVRIAERAAAKEAKVASAQHIGTVGERRDFELTLKFKTMYETQFGLTKIYVMEDQAGNVVVYKGSSYLDNIDGNPSEAGDQIKFKATIKEHGSRDGIAQTIVSRPKVM